MSNKKQMKSNTPMWEKLLPWGIVIVVLLFIGINSSINRNAANNKPQETTEQRQVREKEEALAMEEQKARQARDYCAERNDDTRLYSVMKIEETAEGRKIDFNINKKPGTALTTTDCRQIIDALYDWKTERLEEVIQRTYWIGMPRVSLVASVGLPDDVNSSNYGSGDQEQLVYRQDDYGVNSVYIYLNQDDKVSSYQDF